MTLATAAIAGGLIIFHDINPELFVSSGFYMFGRAVIYKFSNIFATRMAGMFMISLGTI